MSKISAVISIIEGDEYRLFIASFQIISDFLISSRGDKVNISPNSKVYSELVLSDKSNAKIFTENSIYEILTIALRDTNSCRCRMEVLDDQQLVHSKEDSMFFQEVILDSDVIYSILDRAVINKSRNRLVGFISDV